VISVTLVTAPLVALALWLGGVRSPGEMALALAWTYGCCWLFARSMAGAT
jgi:hypothetical protein